MSQSVEKKSVSISWELETIVSQRAQPPQVLLLHGFMQTAGKFFGQIEPIMESHVGFGALGAPFPVVKMRKEAPMDLGYSWFFYDSKTQTYLVDREQCLSFLTDSLKALGWATHIKKIIGFSQGGYVAPFLAERLPAVEQVVGLHARFRHEDFTKVPAFRLDQIHGEDDQVVDMQNSLESHDKLMALGANGEFQKVPGVGHQINDKVLQALQNMIYETSA